MHMILGYLAIYSPALKKMGLYWICHVLLSFRDSVTAKLKYILLNNFYEMKLILHLVFKVNKV